MFLVTGGTGLLGNNVIRALVARGERVRALVRRPAEAARCLAGLDVEMVPGDVRDAGAVDEAMRGVDVVVHSAGHVHIGWSGIEKHRAVNVDGTRNVAEAALRNGTRLVHVSSTNALGVGGRTFEADEEHFDPDIVPCTYVVTKREAETLVLDLVERGLHATIVMPGFMLGPWDWKPSSGRMVVEVGTRFLPLAPSGSFTVCDARDVAAGTLAAAERGCPGRRYLLCGVNLRYLELWRKVAALAGRPGPLGPLGPMQKWGLGWFGDLWYRLTGDEPDVNSAAIRMSSVHHRFSSHRAREELGYTTRPLDETLRDTWDWFRSHGYVGAATSSSSSTHERQPA
jgi:dihydroflavonol-4-reductase